MTRSGTKKIFDDIFVELKKEPVIIDDYPYFGWDGDDGPGWWEDI